MVPIPKLLCLVVYKKEVCATRGLSLPHTALLPCTQSGDAQIRQTARIRQRSDPPLTGRYLILGSGEGPCPEDNKRLVPCLARANHLRNIAASATLLPWLLGHWLGQSPWPCTLVARGMTSLTVFAPIRSIYPFRLQHIRLYVGLEYPYCVYRPNIRRFAISSGPRGLGTQGHPIGPRSP